MLGLCTGALAAAAISSCSTLSELLPAAVQTVQVAFRLGLCVVDVRDRIEAPSESIPHEWSIVFPGLEPKLAVLAIEDFCKANVGDHLQKSDFHSCLLGSPKDIATLGWRLCCQIYHDQWPSKYSQATARISVLWQVQAKKDSDLCSRSYISSLHCRRCHDNLRDDSKY